MAFRQPLKSLLARLGRRQRVEQSSVPPIVQDSWATDGLPESTFRASLEWSYARLTQEQQEALAQLSVFGGSWTLERLAKSVKLSRLRHWLNNWCSAAS